LYLFFHSDFALKTFGAFAQKRGTLVSVIIFGTLGGLIGTAIGVGYYKFLSISKTHIAALLSHDTLSEKSKGPSPATLPDVTAASLVIKFTNSAPYQIYDSRGEYAFRVGVYNGGKVAADNVAVRLISVMPRPRSPMSGTAFPYSMFTTTGREFVRINPEAEEFFTVARSWISSEGRVIAADLYTKVQNGPGRDWIPIDKDEVWHLVVRATAANAKTAEIELEMRPGKEAVEVNSTQGQIAEAKPTSTRHLPDITWDLHHVIGMSGGGGQDVWVNGFQLHGKNNLDRPILHMSGVWRSDVTNEELPVVFDVDNKFVKPEDTNGIPRNADFNIYSTPIPASDPPREGISATRFLRDYASVTLDLTYDGKKFVHHFTNDEIWRQIEAFRRISLPAPSPSTTKKQPRN